METSHKTFKSIFLSLVSMQMFIWYYKTQISYSSQDLKSNPSGLISAEAACLSFSSLLISAVTHTSCLFYSESARTRGGDGVVA